MDLPLRVWIERPDGREEVVGTTPCPGGVEVPRHRSWWVEPWDVCCPDALAAALVAHALDGVELRDAAQLTAALAARPAALRRLAISGPGLDRGTLEAVGRRLDVTRPWAA